MLEVQPFSRREPDVTRPVCPEGRPRSGAAGGLVLREVLSFFATLPPCLIGMEACGGAHYWAQRLREYGHTVKLMAPQFVRPYVKANKTDAHDAEAICEAVTRPTMRFVSVKTPEQQAILAVHRARQ